MKITQKMIREVIKSNQMNWHDQNWHKFQALETSIAVNFALRDLNNCDQKDIKLIQKTAQNFYDQQTLNRIE